MPLTDVKIRQAKASIKPIKITDANGLYIEVKPNGSKLWRYRYELNGKENVFAVGEYPEVSLKAARAARDSARALVKKGTHPSHARRIELVNTIEAGRETFKVVCEERLGKKNTTWTPRDEIAAIYCRRPLYRSKRTVLDHCWRSRGNYPIRITTLELHR